MMLNLKEVAAGPAMEVCVLEIDGRREALEFVGGLQERAQRRFFVIFRLLAQAGYVGRDEHAFKCLEGPVWEIKEDSANARLFCFRWKGALVVCTHGTAKPAGKGSAQYHEAIRKVRQLLEDCKTAGVLP